MPEETQEQILFYSSKGEHGYMSNFSPHSFYDYKGYLYRTSEHYFQAHKFATGSEPFMQILNAKYPMEAANLGRTLRPFNPKIWEAVRDDVMYTAIFYKFTQNPDIMASLVSTKTAKLIENSPIDYYWGCGKDGSGQNKLGHTLMKLREQIKLAVLV